MKDPGHPIWPVVRLVILMGSLCAILYLTASVFDETEVQSLVWAFLAAAGLEGVTYGLSRK